MKIGFYYFATDYSMPIVEVARALEERGYESLFVPEHTHIPASRRSPWPGGAGAAARSIRTRSTRSSASPRPRRSPRKLRLGTGICLLTERDPIVTAKEVATLDLISNGRFEFGIGAGWNAEEMENHGTGFDTRFRVMVDRAKAMQAIWTQDEAAYEGEFTQIRADLVVAQAGAEAASADPAGRRDQAHAAPGDGVLRRLVPARARRSTDRRPRWRACAPRPRRPVATSRPCRPRCSAASPRPAYLERCRAAGMDRVLFALPPEGRDKVMPVIDKYAAFLE